MTPGLPPGVSGLKDRSEPMKWSGRVPLRCRWFGHRWLNCGCAGGWGQRRVCARCEHHEHAAIYPPRKVVR